MSMTRKQVRIGYAPLNDAAPLVLAHELGLFAEFGLDVRLQKQSSWATARDLLQIGALDVTHMLAPIVLATKDKDNSPAMFTPLVLSLCGNSIVVSRALFEAMYEHSPLVGHNALATAQGLAHVAIARRNAGQTLLRFGVVFRQSCHLFDLRRLLRAGGADPDRDVSIAVVPPQETERFLEQGLLDGFSAGEPWGSFAVQRGIGAIVATGHELWPNRIDKVLAFPRGFETEQAAVMSDIVQATILASEWLDQPDNRRAAAGILVDGGYIDLPVDVVMRGLTGRIDRGRGIESQPEPDFVVFERYGAGFPWHSQAEKILAELNYRQTLIAGDARVTTQAAFRTDLYRQCAARLSRAAPAEDYKPEAFHTQAWEIPTRLADDQPGPPIAMAADLRFEDQ